MKSVANKIDEHPDRSPTTINVESKIFNNVKWPVEAAVPRIELQGLLQLKWRHINEP